MNKDYLINKFPFLKEKEKQKQYLQYSLKDFWNWWADPNDVMEISFPRVGYYDIKDLHLPVNKNSCFVNDPEQLLKILKSNLLLKTPIYWGINPRKEIFASFGSAKKFIKKVYGNNNIGVKCIKTILIDMDSDRELGFNATPHALQQTIKNGFMITEKIKKDFGWDNFLMMCSGNGIHIIYKLDKTITLPTLEYEIDDKNERVFYKETPEYQHYVSILRNSFKKYISKIKLEGSKIDHLWDLRRVSRLPYSLNAKIQTDRRFCGIIGISNGENNGMHQYIMDTPMQSVKNFNTTPTHKIKIGKLREEPLVKLLLSRELPPGDRNHYLELSLAKLLRDNKFDITTPEIREIINEIKIVQRKKTIQVDPKYLNDKSCFNMETINAYCWNNGFEFIYPILKNNPKKQKEFITPSKNNATKSENKEVMDIIKFQTYDYSHIKYLVKLLKIEFKEEMWGSENTTILFLYNNLPEDIWKRLNDTGLLKQLLESIY